MSIVVIFFVIRPLRQTTGDQQTLPLVAAEGIPSAPMPLAGEVSYGVDKRPMPTGEVFDVLLPSQVGSFIRESIREPNDIAQILGHVNLNMMARYTKHTQERLSEAAERMSH